MAVDLKRMCDKCLRPVSDREGMVAFKVVDDFDFAVVFKGHQPCMEQLANELGQIYGGLKEKVEDE